MNHQSQHLLARVSALESLSIFYSKSIQLKDWRDYAMQG